MSKRITSTILAGIALVAVVGLSGCSTTDGTGKPSASPSASQKPAAESIDGKAPETGTCDHGQMTIVDGDLEADRSFTVSKSCDLVAVLSSDAHITIEQDVTTLSIEGSNTTVTAAGIKQSLNMGGNNTVQYTGSAPKKVADDDMTDYQQR